MKKNKYRWREMTDEKPEFKEWVLTLPYDFENRKNQGIYPNSGQYLGEVKNSPNDDPEIYINYRNTGFPVIIKSRSLLWRKMCKLPGEK